MPSPFSSQRFLIVTLNLLALTLFFSSCELLVNPDKDKLAKFTDAMTDNGNVDDVTRQQVREQFSSQEIIEIAMVAAFYTAVSQFSHTVRVRPELAASTYGVGDSV